MKLSRSLQPLRVSDLHLFFIDLYIPLLVPYSMQLGTQDTQPHDMLVLGNLNIVRRAAFDIHHENGHINEDATLDINDGHDIIDPTIQNGR